MITVNGIEFQWTEGMTLKEAAALLKERRGVGIEIGFCAINDHFFEVKDLHKVMLADGDKIHLMSSISGG